MKQLEESNVLTHVYLLVGLLVCVGLMTLKPTVDGCHLSVYVF